MNKFFTSVCLMFIGLLSYGQVRLGGLPLSTQTRMLSEVEAISLPRPNYEAAAEEDKTARVGAYRVGLVQTVDIKFPTSGTFKYLNDGKVVWIAKIHVPEAKSLDIYFNNFHLPEGVKMFFINGNQKQVEGAFSFSSNNDERVFASPTIQNNIACVELDIDNISEISKISFTIDKVVAIYRGGMQERLNALYSDNTGSQIMSMYSDTCHINAVCPIADPYKITRKTAVHISMLGYVCSGNLINNTNYDCSPLLLTASHCESSNSFNSSTFSLWKFYFNYELKDCNDKSNTNIESSKNQYTTGATFLARSPLLSSSQNASLIGDFLLLKLNDMGLKIGNDYPAAYAGWDRSFAPMYGEKYFGFHHPGGDAKKFTLFQKVLGTGSFNGGGSNTHWSAQLQRGGIQGGSSGSGLFVGSTQRLIGDLSGGREGGICDTNIIYSSQYSKFNLNWEYINGGNNTPQQRLKDHLDPGNKGLEYVNTYERQNSQCVDAIDPKINIKDNVGKLLNSFHVFPQPSPNGKFVINFNLDKPTKISINIYDVLGKLSSSYNLNSVQSDRFNIDLSEFNSGVYIMRISDGITTVGKKIVIAK